MKYKVAIKNKIELLGEQTKAKAMFSILSDKYEEVSDLVSKNSDVLSDVEETMNARISEHLKKVQFKLENLESIDRWLEPFILILNELQILDCASKNVFQFLKGSNEFSRIIVQAKMTLQNRILSEVETLRDDVHNYSCLKAETTIDTVLKLLNLDYFADMPAMVGSGLFREVVCPKVQLQKELLQEAMLSKIL